MKYILYFHNSFIHSFSDTDLLDRAERRDLPTAHQELIAQARNNDTTSLNTSTEMIFNDMDNSMNWNTSNSFENIFEQRQRTPARRRSGTSKKKLFKNYFF